MKVFAATTNFAIANLGIFFLTTLVVANYSSVISQFSADDSTTELSYSELTGKAYELTQQDQTEKSISQVIELCEQAMKTDAEDKSYAQALASWAYTQLGNEQSDSKIALENFSRAIELDPKSVLSHHARAVTLGQLGQYKEALISFDTAIELNPSYAKAWHNRGEIRFALNEPELAIHDFDKAIDLDSTLAESYAGRGHAKFKLGKFDRALEDYDICCRLEPKNHQALSNRALVHQALGDWEKSMDDFRAALELDQSQGETYRRVAWLMATCPDPRQRNPEVALQAAEKAMELVGEPKAPFLDALAAAQAASGNYDEATTTIKKAIELASQGDSKDLERRRDLYAEKKTFTQGETIQR